MMEIERDLFEAWIKKDSGDLNMFGSGENKHYLNSAVNNAWTGWEARSSIKLISPTILETIGDLLSDAMDTAVKNGANSISMPDEYVALAVWLNEF